MKEILSIKCKDIFLLEILEKDKEELEKNNNIFHRYKINLELPRMKRNRKLEDVCTKIYKRSKKQKPDRKLSTTEKEFIDHTYFLLGEQGEEKYLRMVEKVNKKLLKLASGNSKVS